jgi:hypothetical protein
MDFESATSEFQAGGLVGVYGNQDAEPFGSGTDISWNASTETYTFTRSDGLTISVGPGDIVDSNGSGGAVYEKVDGSLQHNIAISGTGDVDGVSLTYHVISNWNVLDSSTFTNTNQFQVWGLQTESMPTSGTATYNADGAIGLNGYRASDMSAYNFQPDSTGDLEVNFGTGSIVTTLHLIGYDAVDDATVDFGMFTGNGAIDSGAEFSGDFGGDSAFYGAFFGPNAEEFGYAMYINGSDLDITGTVSGFDPVP